MRKAEIVVALRAGTVTATELELRHGISAEETRNVGHRLRHAWTGRLASDQARASD